MSFENSHDYYPLDADTFKPLGDRILVQWEEKKETLLNGLLIAPQTNQRQHYTGIVISKGPDVFIDVEKGDRIMFDQFSGFEKFYDKKHGRLALVEERKQRECFAVIPKRVDIKNGELGYDYAA